MWRRVRPISQGLAWVLLAVLLVHILLTLFDG